MIVWEETMSTGIPLLDIQHKTLFERFNEFSLSIAGDSHVSREAASDVLDFLQFYADWHFSQEEKQMDQHNCSSAAENKRAHDEFRSTFGEFYKQWHTEDMSIALARKTYVELEDWLVNHVMYTDTHLREAVEKGKSQT
jgi:hemerythrin